MIENIHPSTHGYQLPHMKVRPEAVCPTTHTLRLPWKPRRTLVDGHGPRPDYGMRISGVMRISVSSLFSMDKDQTLLCNDDITPPSHLLAHTMLVRRHPHRCSLNYARCNYTIYIIIDAARRKRIMLVSNSEDRVRGYGMRISAVMRISVSSLLWTKNMRMKIV